MSKKDFFKGWYFKCSAEDKTVAFISAIHESDGVKSASLQIITDEEVFNIPFENMEYKEKPLCVNLGDCVFSENGIVLNIKNENADVTGKLDFSNLSPIKYDIMGPFSVIPFMECKHSVVSMKHRVSGKISINGKAFCFKDGAGYIEGDCGRSFPDRYIWTQCCFEGGSLMLAVADIPLFGLKFTGIIGVVFYEGKEYRIATYLGAKINGLKENGVTVKQGKYRFVAELVKSNSHPLNAPVNGKMKRTIHESASCTAHYAFYIGKEKVFDITSDRASFEFEY